MRWSADKRRVETKQAGEVRWRWIRWMIFLNWQKRERTCNGESWGFRGEAGRARIVGMEAVCLRVLLFFDFVAALPATAGAVDSHLCCATFRVKYNFFEIRLTRFAQSIYACISLVFLSFYIFLYNLITNYFRNKYNSNERSGLFWDIFLIIEWFLKFINFTTYIVEILLFLASLVDFSYSSNNLNIYKGILDKLRNHEDWNYIFFDQSYCHRCPLIIFRRYDG